MSLWKGMETKLVFIYCKSLSNNLIIYLIQKIVVWLRLWKRFGLHFQSFVD
jgi:hypothetical protein